VLDNTVSQKSDLLFYWILLLFLDAERLSVGYLTGLCYIGGPYIGQKIF
jgi:hypothetical protein